MIINVISCIAELREYADRYNESQCEELWEKLVVEPYWEKLCCYSPVMLDDRKPACIKSIDALRRQIAKLDAIDLIAMKDELTQIANKLPNYDDDPITVMIFPLDDDNGLVNDKQNGVIGTSLYGNIMIQVNPLVQDYEKWIPYVFAHEYHHTVWGNYWFCMHGSELRNDLLQALVIDGEADSFALSVCENLKPQWLYLDNGEMIEKQYMTYYFNQLLSTTFDYGSLMFGNSEKGIGWCCGYAVGYRIVQKYLLKHALDFSALIEISPADLLI